MPSSNVQAIVSRGRLSDDGWNIERVDVRKPGHGELLVEMVASGVCHTDVLIGDLPADTSPVAFYPRVLGHEGTVNHTSVEALRVRCCFILEAAV